MGLKWYDWRSNGHGEITTKGTSEAQAREEAADRLNCGEDEIVCTGHRPFWQPGIPAPTRIGGLRRRAVEDAGPYG